MLSIDSLHTVKFHDFFLHVILVIISYNSKFTTWNRILQKKHDQLILIKLFQGTMVA